MSRPRERRRSSGGEPPLDLRLTPDDRPSATGPLRSAPRPRTGRGKKRRRGRGRSGSGRGILARAVYWGILLGLWGLIGIGGVVAWQAAQLPPTRDLAIPARPPNVAMLAVSGTVFANRGAMGGESLRLEQMPKYLPRAVIAIEDQRFYKHMGIDPIGLARAAFVNITTGEVVQGGSTITQQLAKNLFLTPERTLSRKIQEVILSLWLEAEYSKDHILETYLNRVYFGAGTYGVEAAAQRYFGKSARDVTLGEAAMLAGLLKAPSKYAPTRNPEAARSRADVVLAEMVEAGFIRENQAQVALAENIRITRGAAASGIDYAADWIMDQVEGFIGEVETDVLVDTTVDLMLQDAAERALEEGLAGEGARLNASQGALVSIDGTGAVRALVGGRSYAESQYNRAVTAKRQPGSAFKPFVWLAALEQGMTADTVREDRPVRIGNWTPENFDHKYRGPVTLREALALSLNTVAARLAAEVGPSNVIRTAYRLGVASKLRPDASIALGTSEVTPLELTAAYAPFGNGGYAVIPYVVLRIRTKDGRTLYERKSSGYRRVVDPEHVSQMNRMLADTIEVGTGRRANLPGWQAAGKTGTSQDYRDAWFIGYTANLTTGVWLGNDDNRRMKRATGGSLPAAIWSRYMNEAHRGIPVAMLPGLGRGDFATASAAAEADLPWRHRDRQEARRTSDFFRIDTGFLRRLFGG